MDKEGGLSSPLADERLLFFHCSLLGQSVFRGLELLKIRDRKKGNISAGLLDGHGFEPAWLS